MSLLSTGFEKDEIDQTHCGHHQAIQKVEKLWKKKKSNNSDYVSELPVTEATDWKEEALIHFATHLRTSVAGETSSSEKKSAGGEYRSLAPHRDHTCCWCRGLDETMDEPPDEISAAVPVLVATRLLLVIHSKCPPTHLFQVFHIIF